MFSTSTLVNLAVAISLVNAGLGQGVSPRSKLYVLNGLSDNLFERSDPCVQNCFETYKSTEMTPCPPWDTECLCIFQNYNDIWMGCVLEECPQFAKDAEERANAVCKAKGFPHIRSVAFSDLVMAEIKKDKLQASVAASENGQDSKRYTEIENGISDDDKSRGF